MKQPVLFLFNSGEIIGGGELSLLEFLLHLDKERFRPYVVCPRQGELVDELRRQGLMVRTIEMPSPRKMNLLRIMMGVIRMYRWIKRNHIVLVHANGSRCAVYGTLAARLARVPVVWHVRIMGRDKWLDPMLARLSTRIVVISHAVRRRFSRLHYAQRKLVMIHNGIDIKKFDPAAGRPQLRKEFSFGEEVPLVGMIGRMDLYKDCATLLHAARDLLKKIPDAKLILVGRGELMEKMKELAHQLQIEKSVFFLGYRSDVVNILSSLDVVVLSSKSEGFGRSIAEAMAMQKPVVGSRVGGIEEIIEDGVSGILVAVKDSEGLAEAIEKLLRHPAQARQMGIQARHRIQEHFSMAQHMREMENLYEELLKEEAT